jgi:ribosome modulation factor
MGKQSKIRNHEVQEPPVEDLKVSPQNARNREQDQNVRIAREKGRTARISGKDVWLNPFTGLRARAWTQGWEEAS